MTSRHRRGAALAGLALGLLLAAPAAAAKAKPPAPTLDVRTADRLAGTPPAAPRDAQLAAWARTAGLADLVFVLRRPESELGAAEGPLVRAALDRCPAERAALRRRLELRLALADPRAGRELGRLAALVSALPSRPRASVFRLGLLLPDTGRYAAYSRAVQAGVEAALSDANSVALHPVEVARWSTGGDQPERAAAAFDSAATGCGVVLGELLSVPTFTIAAGARLLGVPLLSPTATDEAIGRVGPAVFQIGPSGLRRGAMLGRLALEGGARRIGTLVSGDYDDSPLARGFAAAAESAGVGIAWRGTYAAGATDLRAAARAIAARKLDALLFDGEPREARALIAQLAQGGVSLALFGGEALNPDGFPADARVLMEGVRFAGEDWTVPAGVQARLDSIAAAIGEPRGTSLFVRGYYAGRLIGAAVHSGGALAPEEVAAWLEARRDPLPAAAAANFLDCAAENARIPLYVVRRGRAVPVE